MHALNSKKQTKLLINIFRFKIFTLSYDNDKLLYKRIVEKYFLRIINVVLKIKRLSIDVVLTNMLNAQI